MLPNEHFTQFIRQAGLVLAVLASPLGLLPLGLEISSPAQSRSEVLNIGYIESAFYDLRVKDAQVALEMWGSSLINHETSPLNKVSAIIIPTFEELERAVTNEELDVVIMGTVDYLKLAKSGLLEPVLAPQPRPDCMQNYLLLVRKDRGIGELGQLKNGRLVCVLGGEGDLPKIWLDNSLFKAGRGGAETFFKEIKYVDKAAQAVLPVFFKQADVCLATERSFNSLKELNPQVGSELSILATSPNLLRGLICFRKSRDQAEKKRTYDVMSKIHEDPQGQQILLLFHEERLAPFRPDYLETAQALLEEYERNRAENERAKKGNIP